jgi:iron complex outermembrane receptor protein
MSEQSNNIDLTFNYSNDGLYAGLTFFQNDVNNYIYLMDEDDDHIMDEDDDPHHDLPHANYLQQDAEFKGYELEIGKTFDLARGALTLAFGRDSVSGEFTDGHNIPRMTPERDLYKVVYVEETLKFVLSLKDVSAQNDTAENETASDGFQMLNLNLSKTIESSSGNILTLSVFGKNLLDEAARNHSSFVKDEVPLAGRNLGVRASYSF